MRATVPVPVLGLAGQGVSLQSATRLPNGSILLGGRRDGRAFVARVRPNGRLDERFGHAGLWIGAAQTRVVQLLVSEDGGRIGVEVRPQRGVDPGRLHLLRGDGRLVRVLQAQSAFGLAAAFQGSELAIVTSSASCTDCQMQRYAAATGTPIGAPTVLAPAPGDRCAPRSLSALVAVEGGWLASTDDLGPCTHAVVVIDRSGAMTAAERTPGRWSFAPALPGGQACAVSAGGVTSPDLAAPGPALTFPEIPGQIALGSVGVPGPVLPTLRALPASVPDAAGWRTAAVFATGSSSCGVLMDDVNASKGLLLRGTGWDQFVRLASGRASTVAARCLDHVLVFGTVKAGTVRQVVVQAVALSRAQRAGLTAQAFTASAVSCARWA